jgi:hypothetical protein
MSMLQNRSSPNIPQAPAQYDVAYMNALSNVIRLFFNNINTVQQLNLASLNLDLRTLPTDADLPNLRIGDVYRDTQDGVQATSQMLRIKVPVELTGVQGTGAVGSVGAVGGTITKNLTGISGSGAVGSVADTINLDLTGVSGAGAVGTVTP